MASKDTDQLRSPTVAEPQGLFQPLHGFSILTLRRLRGRLQ